MSIRGFSITLWGRNSLTCITFQCCTVAEQIQGKLKNKKKIETYGYENNLYRNWKWCDTLSDKKLKY